MRKVKFFWWAAVALSLWELLIEPLFAERQTVVCTSGAPLEMQPPGPLAEAAEFLGLWLTLLQPILLALIALWAIRSPARTAVSQRAVGSPPTAPGPAARLLPTTPGTAATLLPTTLGLAFALLPTALAEIEERLSPEAPFWWRECLEAQLTPPSFAVPRLVLAWLLSPATMVVLAGMAAAGIRPRLTDLRNLGTAAAAVMLAALMPGLLVGLPDNADGTPRYVVTGEGLSSYVLDLESGDPVSSLPEATRTYAIYDRIVRDKEPGNYIAAITSPSGGYFRLYRLAMGADGRVTVGERLTPTIKGTVNGLAVSSEGRIAYGRLTDEPGFGVVGTLEREWPANGYGVQWLDARTLALPSHSVPADGVAALDVGTGAIRRLPAPAEHEIYNPFLVLPGGRQLRVLGRPARTLVLHEGTRRIRTLLDLNCGHIESLALAPTGRHMLVGIDREADRMDRSPLAGLPPCGGAPSQLLRLELESGNAQIVPGKQGSWVQAW
ncbi:hypothetical protein [Nonomuraea insulae]|uniref:Uncharacterized protein n=1 Tax=Nonomuraea insulae TaxID=1616787 RepID=A0ABW1CMQ7_9ACTN